MAEATILFAVKNMEDLLIHGNLLQGAEEQVKLLKDELQSMQRFMKDASEKQDNDERICEWISDIREVAQEADHIIDALFLQVEATKRSIESRGELVYIPKRHYNLMAKQIENIRAKLRDSEIIGKRYGIQDLSHDGMEYSWRRRQQLSPRQKYKQLVGIEEDVVVLVEKVILEKGEGLSTTSIVGTTGIGKSALARKIYDRAVASNRYIQCVWIVVSGECMTPNDVIKELLLQFVNPLEDKLKEAEKLKDLSLSGIQEILHECVDGGQLFLVLDDVRRDAQWESIASVFTTEDKGSAMLITSHNKDAVEHAGYVHEMKTLDPYKSWGLLTNKASVDNVGGNFSEDLEIIGREILKKCDGLPLAIALVGGLLRDKNPSKRKWEKVLNDINTHLERSGGGSSILSTILELSYRDLTPQLKSCFLCLGLFEEHVPIRAEKLVQVWIAQGFVVPVEGGEEEETKEEIGWSYLHELIDRNMVQVEDLKMDGRVKNCCIHDLVRDLSITKARREINFEILKEDWKSRSLDKPRHLAIGGGDQRFVYTSKNRNEHVHSIFFHGVVSNLFNDNPSYLKSFELLKILDFENFPLENVPDTIGLLIRLRYLGLRRTRIEKLPHSVGRLKSLEVLDITKVHQVEVNDVLWEMESLRHLYGGVIYSDDPLKTETLKNLQTLGYIHVGNLIPEHLVKMTSLRKLSLSIVVGPRFDGRRFYPLLATLENLVCLELRWRLLSTVRSSELKGLETLHRVTKLKLVGTMEALPRASELPPNLSYLTLLNTGRSEDPMPVLEKLSKLVYLKLDCAYIGREDMVISENGFPKLEVLALHNMWGLKNVQVGKGGFAELKKLQVCECHKNLGSGFSEELRSMTTFVQKSRCN